jgi:hypothetical protein
MARIGFGARGVRDRQQFLFELALFIHVRMEETTNRDDFLCSAAGYRKRKHENARKNNGRREPAKK